MAKLRIGDAYLMIGNAFVSIGPNDAELPDYSFLNFGSSGVGFGDDELDFTLDPATAGDPPYDILAVMAVQVIDSDNTLTVTITGWTQVGATVVRDLGGGDWEMISIMTRIVSPGVQPTETIVVSDVANIIQHSQGAGIDFLPVVSTPRLQDLIETGTPISSLFLEEGDPVLDELITLPIAP